MSYVRLGTQASCCYSLSMCPNTFMAVIGGYVLVPRILQHLSRRVQAEALHENAVLRLLRNPRTSR